MSSYKFSACWTDGSSQLVWWEVFSYVLKSSYKSNFPFNTEPASIYTKRNLSCEDLGASPGCMLYLFQALCWYQQAGFLILWKPYKEQTEPL